MIGVYLALVFITFSVDYVFNNILEPHQRARIEELLGIKSDPLGVGYNVNQSKIAIGSGGLYGKGFLRITSYNVCYTKLLRSISGGMLVQDEDEGMDSEFKNVTKIQFDSNKMNLAKFGITACKHLKSNAIAIVTEKEDGSFWLTGADMGQPNRLYSMRQLTMPRFDLKEGVKIEESVVIRNNFV